MEEVVDPLHFPNDILMNPVIFWAFSLVTFWKGQSYQQAVQQTSLIICLDLYKHFEKGGGVRGLVLAQVRVHQDISLACHLVITSLLYLDQVLVFVTNPERKENWHSVGTVR